MFIGFLVSTEAIQAQTRKTCFRAFNGAGQQVTVICVNDRVVFRNCDPLVNPNQTVYFYDATGNPSATTDSVHTYTTPGTYTVIQFANLNDPATPFGRDTIIFRVEERLQPKFLARSCGNNQVEIIITDTNYDNFTVDLGNGTKLPATRGSNRFTLPAASNRITVTGWFTGASCRVDKDTVIHVLPPLTAPALEFVNITANGLLLRTSQLQPEYVYLVDQSDAAGNFTSATPIDTIRAAAGQREFTLARAVTNAPRCYRLRVTDPCNSALGVVSNTVCSIVLSVTAANKENQLSWQTTANAGYSSYTIRRNNQTLQSNFSNTLFTDTSVACGQVYTYVVEGEKNSVTLSASNHVSVTTTSTLPPRPAYLNVSYNLQNQPVLKLTLPSGETFLNMNVQRSSGNNAFQPLRTFTSNPATDRSLPTDEIKPVCYRAVYTDSCGKTTETFSNPACPVILSGSLQNRETALLNWTNYSGFAASEVNLLLLNPDQTVQTSIPVTGSNSYTETSPDPEQQVLLYRIQAIGINPVTNLPDTAYSNLLELVQQFEVYIPTAFSPNNDGLNDIFTAKGRFIKTFDLKIYDRWGQVIFSSTDIEKGWDGKINGKEASSGAYAYTLTATDDKNRIFSRNGVLTLVR